MKEKMLLWLFSVLCLAYLLPNHYSPWLSFHQELAAAIAFYPIILFSCIRLSPVPPIAYGACALAIIPLLQLLTGKISFVTDGLMNSLYLLGFAFAAYAGSKCTWTPNQSNPIKIDSPITVLWTSLLMAALLSAGIAFHQWLLPTYQGIYIAEIPPDSRPFGNLAQPNQLATLLLLGTTGLLYLSEARQIRPWVASAAAFFLLWALVMTGSRSVLLALFWLLPAYALMRKRCNLRTTTGAVAVAVFFYLAMNWLWPILDNLLLLGINKNTAVTRISTSGIRYEIWTSMIDAIGRAPWSGYGWGQVSMAQMGVVLDHPKTHLVLDSAHNLFIDIALWAGLPVALIFISTLAWWFFCQVRNCNNSMKWTTLMGVGVVFNHAMVEYPLNYAYFLLPTGFFMGALSPAYSHTISACSQNISKYFMRTGMTVTSIFVTALSIAVAIEYFPIEADWSLMRFQQAGIGNTEVTEPPSALVLTSLQQFLIFSRSEAKTDMSSQELETMRRVTERFAYAAPMFKYALAQALNHQPEYASTTLRKMCSMQLDSVCKSAKNKWEELAKTRYPVLMGIPFPDFNQNQ